jgi:hypothetical protein
MLHRKNTANATPNRQWEQLVGKVFRRKDLADQLPSVDRELALAVKAGTVRKAAQGLYYVPRRTPFGDVPPSEEALVEKFLDDNHFLMFNPSCYNALGLGTTQLYSKTIVYNHKRHGQFTLAGLEFDFRDKLRFPSRKQVNREYLLVDMLNNLTDLAEDPETVLSNVRRKVDTFDAGRLEKMLADYGSAWTRRVFQQLKLAAHAEDRDFSARLSNFTDLIGY